ncbi:MAG: hypothetical protein AAGU11_11720 [Syntrophobacteraceae bacterium]
MKVKDVVVMREVADDLNDDKACGKAFEQKEPGIGEYFLDSLLAEIESLFIHAGVHIREQGLYRMLSRRIPHAILL